MNDEKVREFMGKYVFSDEANKKEEKLFEVRDNSFIIDIDFNHAIPGGMIYQQSPKFRIIGDVFIPKNQWYYNAFDDKEPVILDTMIQNIETKEVFYVNHGINLKKI